MTIIVGPIARIETVTDAIVKWPLNAVNWKEPRLIDVPPLSLREKLAVDRLLPGAHPRTVINKLNLRFADKYEDSIAASPTMSSCTNSFLSLSEWVCKCLR